MSLTNTPGIALANDSMADHCTAEHLFLLFGNFRGGAVHAHGVASRQRRPESTCTYTLGSRTRRVAYTLVSPPLLENNCSFPSLPRKGYAFLRVQIPELRDIFVVTPISGGVERGGQDLAVKSLCSGKCPLCILWVSAVSLLQGRNWL